MFICRNAEEVHAYLLKCCRGTFSSFGILKGYIVRESFGYLRPRPVLSNLDSVSKVKSNRNHWTMQGKVQWPQQR